MGWPSAIAPPLTLTLSQSKFELAAVGQGLRGERLVDLDEVECLDRQFDLVEQLADAHDRGKEQPAGLDLGLRVADDPGEWRQAVTLDRALARDDRCRGAVRDARRVAGGDAGRERRVAEERRIRVEPLRQREGRPQLREGVERSCRGAGSRPA